jgi:hypothetical protein
VGIASNFVESGESKRMQIAPITSKGDRQRDLSTIHDQ